MKRMSMSITKEELLYVMSSFKKDRSLGLDGWTIELFLDFFDLLGEDLLQVVEEFRSSRNVHVNINTTFIALIFKVDFPKTFERFRPISLCNYLYKVISKVLVVRLKPLLSNLILVEQFGFLEGKKIHESIVQHNKDFILSIFQMIQLLFSNLICLRHMTRSPSSIWDYC